MFSRILIANRGEIALRIIRTCKRMGIETVVVYSQADKDAVYLKLADKRVGLLINFNVVHLRDGIKRLVNNL